MAKNVDKTLACIQISKLSKWIDAQLDSYLREAGVRRGQHATLLAVSDLKQPSLTDIAKRLQVDKAAVTRSVASCEQRGWLTTGFANDNLKTRTVQLTATGETLTIDIVKALHHVERDLKKKLPVSLYQELFDHRDA